MVHSLRYSMILDLTIATISQSSTLGGLTRTITGEQVLVRARQMSARVVFLYKRHELKQFSSWVYLDPAIHEAKRERDHLGLTRDEHGQVAIEVTMTEKSYPLVAPSRDAYALLALDDDQLQRVINQIDGHKPIETIFKSVWSSDSSDAYNVRKCNEVTEAFSAHARAQQDCVADAKALFNQLQRQSA